MNENLQGIKKNNQLFHRYLVDKQEVVITNAAETLTKGYVNYPLAVANGDTSITHLPTGLVVTHYTAVKDTETCKRRIDEIISKITLQDLLDLEKQDDDSTKTYNRILEIIREGNTADYLKEQGEESVEIPELKVAWGKRYSVKDIKRQLNKDAKYVFVYVDDLRILVDNIILKRALTSIGNDIIKFDIVDKHTLQTYVNIGNNRVRLVKEQEHRVLNVKYGELNEFNLPEKI